MTIEFYCHVLLTERRKRNVFVFLFFLSVNYRSHWPKSFAINLESIWISAIQSFILFLPLLASTQCLDSSASRIL